MTEETIAMITSTGLTSFLLIGGSWREYYIMPNKKINRLGVLPSFYLVLPFWKCHESVYKVINCKICNTLYLTHRICPKRPFFETDHWSKCNFLVWNADHCNPLSELSDRFALNNATEKPLKIRLFCKFEADFALDNAMPFWICTK